MTKAKIIGKQFNRSTISDLDIDKEWRKIEIKHAFQDVRTCFVSLYRLKLTKHMIH